MRFPKTIFIAPIVMFFLFRTVFFAFAAEIGKAPDGFRGIKWGTRISQIEDMNPYNGHVGMLNIRGSKLYIREHDKLFIGDITIKNPIYIFKENSFVGVDITLEKQNNLNDLIAIFRGMYGPETDHKKQTDRGGNLEQVWKWIYKEVEIQVISSVILDLDYIDFLKKQGKSPGGMYITYQYKGYTEAAKKAADDL